MSTRSNLAALTAGAGVLALGWSLGTAPAQTTTAQSTTTQATTTQATTTQATTTQATTTQATTTQGGQAQGTDTQSQTQSQTQSTQGSGSSLKDGTHTGQTVTHRYGSVTVTVVVTNGAISSLSENVVSDGDHHSERINEQAVPILRQEVLAANSAQVNTVSGGTYTSDAYLQSLQSALDEAHA